MRLPVTAAIVLLASGLCARPGDGVASNTVAARQEPATPALPILWHNQSAPAASTGGAMVEATSKFTDFMMATFIPLLTQQIKGVAIPDLSGKASGFNYKVSGISINSVDLTKAKLSFKETQGLLINIPFSISIGGHWSYKLHSIPHIPKGSGSFTASAGSGSHIDALLVLGAKNGKPTVSLGSGGLQCGLSISVKTHGSLFSWLYNIIIKAFKGKISSQICAAAKTGVSTLIQSTLAPTLAGLDLRFVVPLPPALQKPNFELALDLSFNSPPVITATSIAVPIRAETLNTKRQDSVQLPPALPVFGAGETHMLSAEVTAWAWNRALVVFQEAGFLTYTVLPDALPASSPVQLTTKAFATFAPGLQTQYPNMPLEVVVNVSAPPVVSLEGGKITVGGPTSFEFRVVTNATTATSTATASVSAFTLTCPLQIGAKLSMTNQVFHLEFSYDGCQLALQSSNVGEVHPLLLGTLLNFIIKTIFVPGANAAFADGFELPPLGGVVLANSQVTLANQTVFIASDLQWSTTQCYCSAVAQKDCAPAISACVSACVSSWGPSCMSCVARYSPQCCQCVGKAVGLAKCPC